MATAILIAFLGVLKAELDFLCTPEGQKLAAKLEERFAKIHERIDWVEEKLKGPTS